MSTELENAASAHGSFRLGDRLVEPRLNRLIRDGESIQLEIKAMDVLVCLAERAGDVVTRQEIVDQVWATEFISDNTLTHAIAELRGALGDDARNPSFIETIHRRGYRLICPIEPINRDEPTTGSVTRFPVPETRFDDDRHPYPGLAAFTEDDAEFFFGREAEVDQLWRKVTSRRLLAVIGPSGVGKSSFLRAGVIPARPEGWGVVVCQPGDAPFAALAQSLVPEFASDEGAISRLVQLREPGEAIAMVSRWRQRHEQVLLIVDQFEELFTQNTPEVQTAFAELLGSLAREADVHVLPAMRDDFLYRSHAHEPLRPIFEDLTALEAPDDDALRRALEAPASCLGYTFENHELVDQMVAEVAEERAALPLLAFAVSKMWDERDRENRLLTRQAHDDIGGVGGALARHAEAVVAEIGYERLPVVREIFRNLVTAEGTRAVRGVGELLSIFNDDGGEGVKPSPTTIAATPAQRTVREVLIPSRESAGDVLKNLIDARLLTSFESHYDEEPSTRRVEIVHESLLANWPRLVRWQTQDQEGAQLRDELRQAAKTWDEHGRHDDRLWTGTAYREFRLWSERYPGGLTEIEEAFGAAMTTYVTRLKRRQRIASTAAFAILFVILVIVGTLWRRSIVETRRAEAAGLLSQAQVELEVYPSAAVAYSIASLELTDSFETRRLALEALWKGPTAFVVNEIPTWAVGFTPDGRWLVQTTDATPYRIHIIGADGSDRVLEDVHEGWVDLRMDRMSGMFATLPTGLYPSEPFALWSAPERRLLTKGRSGYPENTIRAFDDLSRRRMLLLLEEDGDFFVDAHGFDGSSERLGDLPLDLRSSTLCAIAPRGEWFAVAGEQGVDVIEVGDHDLSGPRRLEHVEGPVVDIECDPLGNFVATRYEDGRIRLWDLMGKSPPRSIDGPSGLLRLSITSDGSMLEVSRESDDAATWIWSLETETPTFLRRIDLGKASGSAVWTLNPVDRQLISVFNPDAKIRLWPLGAPADSEPMILGRGDAGVQRGVEAHPMGAWVASSYINRLTLWPVSRPYPTVIRQYEDRVVNLVFAPDGEWLATSSVNHSGTVRKWELIGDSLPPAQIIHEGQTFAYGLAVTPEGGRILLGKYMRRRSSFPRRRAPTGPT